MGFDATSTIIVALTWALALFDAYLLHRAPGDAARRDTAISAVIAALAMTALHPAVYLRLDRAVGIPNFARLVGNGLGIASAWAFAPVIARIARHRVAGRGVLGSIWLMLGAVAAMAWCYSRADTPVSDPYDFQERYGGLPAVAAARFVLFAYLGAILTRLLVLSLRIDRGVRKLPRRDRAQARLQTIGWACGVAFTLYQCLYLALRAAAGATALPYLSWIPHGLLACGCAALASGIVFRAWGWLDRLRAYYRLTPLWADLRAIYPSGPLAFFRPASGAVGLLLRLDFHLLRRAVEIRDGLLLIQPLIGAGTQGDEPSGRTDAAAIARAVVALRSGATIPASVPGTATSVQPHAEGRGEIERLAQLAVAYREARDRIEATTGRDRRI